MDQEGGKGQEADPLAQAKGGEADHPVREDYRHDSASQGQDLEEGKLERDQGPGEEDQDHEAETQDPGQGSDAADPDPEEGGDPPSLL